MRPQPFPWLAAAMLCGSLTACAGSPSAPTTPTRHASALSLRPAPYPATIEHDLTPMLRKADALHVSALPDDGVYLLTVQVRNPLDHPLEALKIIIIDNPRTRGPRRLVLEAGTLDPGQVVAMTAETVSSNPAVRVTGH